jgi:hypothetical protein
MVGARGDPPARPGRHDRRGAPRRPAPPEQVIHPAGLDGVDLVPGSRAAASFNTPDPRLADLEQQDVLRSFLEEAAAGTTWR